MVTFRFPVHMLFRKYRLLGFVLQHSMPDVSLHLSAAINMVQLCNRSLNPKSNLLKVLAKCLCQIIVLVLLYASKLKLVNALLFM